MKRAKSRHKKSAPIIGIVFMTVSFLALLALLIIGYIAYRNNAFPFQLPPLFVKIIEQTGRRENEVEDQFISINPQTEEIRTALAQITPLQAGQESDLAELYRLESELSILLDEAAKTYPENEALKNMASQQSFHLSVLSGTLTKYALESSASESASLELSASRETTACKELLDRETGIVALYTQLEETTQDEDLKKIIEQRIRESELSRQTELQTCAE